MANYDDTATVSGSVVSFADGADEVPCKSVKVTLPASLDGYASAMETQTGANIWNELWEVGSLTSSGADYPSTTRIRSIGYTTVKGGVTCYINSAGYTADIHFYKDDYTHISYVQKTNTTFSIPSDAKYIRFCMAVAYGTTYNNNILICYGSTAHAYEPYQTPTTYSANLGRTVYGATVGFVSGTGKETCSLPTLLSSLTWTKTTQGGHDCFFANLPNGYIGIGSDFVDGDCDSYAITKDGNMGTDETIRFYFNSNFNISRCVIRDDQYASYTGAQFKEVVTGNIVYQLKESAQTDFTFDGQEIPTRKGYNAFWSEQGDSEVTYYKDGYGFTSVTVNKTGKNLIDGTKFTRGLPSTTIGASIDTITASNRYAYYGIRAGGGSLTVSSTSSDTDYFTLVLIWGYKDGVLTYYSNTQPGTSKTVDFSNCDYVRIGIGAKSGTTVPTDLTGYGTIQLELGSQASSYEPYEAVSKTAKLHRIVYGGTADVVKGTCEPKNLLKVTGEKTTYADITYTVNDKGQVMANGTATALRSFKVIKNGDPGFSFKKGVTYTLSGCPSGGSDQTYQLDLRNTNTVGTFFMNAKDYGNGVTFTPTEDAVAFPIILVRNGQVCDNLTFNPQIEVNSSKTEYAPHFDPFTFPPISIGTDEGENTLFANEGDSSITYRKAVD